MPEWDLYEAQFPKAGERSSNAAVLKTAHHVVHVPAARRILEDEELRSGLVYDESPLNKSRLSVNWLSANTWAHGSIYGNVQFSFPWSMLIEGRRFYWVEAMTAYRPHAYRILITDRDLNHSRLLTPYDPYSDKGPLRERDGVWYWNYDYTSEFMFEGDLDLAEWPNAPHLISSVITNNAVDPTEVSVATKVHQNIVPAHACFPSFWATISIAWITC